MKTTRREFIKISSLGVGTLVFASPLSGCFTGSKAEYDETKSKRIPTYCEVCFWKCAGWVYTNSEGEIWKIIGNDDDPHSNGRFCPRGTGGVGMYYDNDRLKTPLIRVTNKDGKQEFKKASWDEALDLIVKRLNEVRQKYGPESVALFTHGTGSGYFHTLFKALGTENIAEPAYAQCRGPREVAFKTTFGAQIKSPEPTDIKNTECLVLIGSHIGENMHNGQVQEVSELVERGGTIITVDPRFSTVAGKSKYWLPIKPSTDLALLLAWIHEIIYNEWYDKEYVEKYTFGFDLLKNHVKNFTPEWAYGITSLKPDLIRKTAKEMAKASPAVIIHPGRHVTWYGDDTQRLRAVAILNALLGSWGRKGGFFLPNKVKLPKKKLPEFPEPEWTWRNLGKYPLAGMGITNALVDLTLEPDDKKEKVRAWFVNATNIINTLPDRQRTLDALDNVEFLVVVETMPSEITGYADVILPEATYLERWDKIRASQHRVPNIAIRMPAAKPRWDTKPGYWIARQLAVKFGVEKYFPWETIEDEIKWQCEQLGISFDELKEKGVVKIDKFFYPIYFADGEDIEFNTNTGKIELYATDLEAIGADPMPKYTPHPEPDPGFYRLIYGRAPMHTFSRTINNPNLNDLMEENALWVNPKVANEWGLENGQYVWLKNQKGIVSEFSVKVRVTERIRWDSVYLVHGFGHSNKKLRRAYGKGVNDSLLISDVKIDPVMGGTGMRSNFVTFLTEKPGKEEVEA